MKLHYVGLRGPNGLLVWASECNSQLEGSEFDGPVLWGDLDEAIAANDECGGVPDDHELVQVTVSYKSPNDSAE